MYQLFTESLIWSTCVWQTGCTWFTEVESFCHLKKTVKAFKSTFIPYPLSFILHNSRKETFFFDFYLPLCIFLEM